MTIFTHDPRLLGEAVAILEEISKEYGAIIRATDPELAERVAMFLLEAPIGRKARKEP